MERRWTLNRAGITNVYQYGEEILTFGGGRLLLRGVNGSGKSTAMNMLLPFLLDADVRRIDAAGEQSGVLASWMLSGRDDIQPTGYLWLEMARGDEYVTFGCGIRANQKTRSVNHWWFLTDRRPGIDLALVRTHGGSARTPLSAEELRAEIGSHAVWASSARPAYRAAVRERLYGGADLDQHLRLLHIVRNPRVGDRVDVELPQHLHDALPQLSEAAIDDAATPLEQLDEHRRNVAGLTETVAALEALMVTYTNHARGELHARADTASSIVDAHRRQQRAVQAAVDELENAKTDAAALERAVTDLDAEAQRLGVEIDQLKASELYKDATDLDERRRTVDVLRRVAADARHNAERVAALVSGAESTVAAARHTANEATQRVRADADELTDLATAAGLGVQPPTWPEVVAHERRAAGRSVTVPIAALDLDPAATQELTVAALVRRGHIAEAQRKLAEVTEAERLLTQRERELADAEVAHTTATEAATEAAEQLAATAEAWRAEGSRWLERVVAHAIGSGFAVPETPDLTGADVVADIRSLEADLTGVIDRVLAVHQRRIAQLANRRDTLGDIHREADALVKELAARREPDPPTATWQTPRSGPCLAELVDFADHVSAEERAGLEAALEASGLLAAEPRPDGALTVGDLVLRPTGPAVPAPLGELLTVVIPDTHPVEPTALVGILDRITTDEATAGTDAVAVVTTDGAFRVGPLHGVHAKPVAEHIGVTARQEALRRQREQAATALVAATEALAAAEVDLTDATARAASATNLRSDLPDITPVREAALVAAQAEKARTGAEATLEGATDARRAADAHHAQRVDDAHHTCVSFGLPRQPEALTVLDQRCHDIPNVADTLTRSLEALTGAVGHWIDAGEQWARLADAAHDATRQADAADTQHDQAAAALATLEDAIGLDGREVIATVAHTEEERDRVTERRRALDETRPAAGARVGEARSRLDRARLDETATESHCRDTLVALRATLAVPGLLDAAAADDDPTIPAVPDSPEGLGLLADAIRRVVPSSATPVTAEGVRIAVRQRRSDLGAGWDADAFQPDPAQPIAIDVNGPLGRGVALASAARAAADELAVKEGLLSAQQHNALRNLLQGLIAKEVAEKLLAAGELVTRMNERLRSVRTAHGIGVSLRWRRRDDLDTDISAMVELLARPPDLRSPDDDTRLLDALSSRIADARLAEPEADYRTLIGSVLDYRAWHRVQVVVHRGGAPDAVLSRRTPLSEGEKKIVSYQPLFAAVAASCDALAERAPTTPRFILLDDAFAKVSEDNHAKLFGLLVDLDLDFIATSERLTGTHDTVPELAITEVVRDADAGVIVLEHAHWDGRTRREAS